MAYTKMVQFVDTIEVYEYSKSIYPKKHRKIIKRSSYPRRRSKRSVARAKKNFFNLVKNQLNSIEELPYIITLTYHNQYEAPPSLADSSLHFNSFFRKTKEIFGKHISYIAVPEYQERNYLHYHAMVWGLPKSIEEERTNRILQRCWLQGYVDVLATYNKSDALPGYLAKYFSKTYSDIRFYNRKTYTASRNINRPTETGFNGLSNFLSTFIEDSNLIDRVEYETMFLGRTVKTTYKTNQKHL